MAAQQTFEVRIALSQQRSAMVSSITTYQKKSREHW